MVPAYLAKCRRPYKIALVTPATLRHHTTMAQNKDQWLLYRYEQLEFVPLSKPFKTRAEAEKARAKYPEKQRKGIGIGLIKRAA